MPRFKSAYLIYLNLVVAISTGVLSGGYAFRLGVEHWYEYALFGFFSTMAVYNGQRLLKSDAAIRTPWLRWVEKNKAFLFLLSIFCLLGAATLLIRLNIWKWETLMLLAVSGVISILYVIKINGMNMRELPHMKIHLISLSWVVVLLLFPAIQEGAELRWEVFVAHYIYVLAVTIPFDIRDLKYDRERQKTIPQVLGVNGSKVLSILLLAGFTAIMFYSDPNLMHNFVFHLAVSIQVALVVFMNEERSDLYCAGWIDGAIAILGASYFLV